MIFLRPDMLEVIIWFFSGFLRALDIAWQQDDLQKLWKAWKKFQWTTISLSQKGTSNQSQRYSESVYFIRIFVMTNYYVTFAHVVALQLPRGSVVDLLAPGYFRTTVLLWFIWWVYFSRYLSVKDFHCIWGNLYMHACKFIVNAQDIIASEMNCLIFSKVSLTIMWPGINTFIESSMWLLSSDNH